MAKKVETNVWDVKYAPQTFEDYIGSNETIVNKFTEFIENQDIPHLLLYGPSGTGKSSINNILVDNLDADVLNIMESDIATVRTKIKQFITAGSWKKFKIVRIEEFRFKQAAQIELNEYLEKYFNHCRFIITTNYYDTIIPSIKSRFAKGTFKVNAPDKVEIVKHIENILNSNKIKFEMKDVATIVKKHYPDIRSILGVTQLNVINNELTLAKDNFNGINHLSKIVDVLTDKKINKNASYIQIRRILADAGLSDFQPVFRFLYDKVPELSKDIPTQANIDIILAETQSEIMLVNDMEINMMNGLIKIIGELK